MSASTPYNEPARIVAGDTAKWLKSLPEYPASAGWVLGYTLVNSDNRYTTTATASGDEHLTTIDAAITDTWKAGEYALRGRVLRAGEVFTVFEARVAVAASYRVMVDSRTQARRSLDAVEAVLDGRAADGVAEYTIGGRAVKRIPVPELLKLRDRLRFDVARENDAARAAAGLAPRGRIAVRFGAW